MFKLALSLSLVACVTGSSRGITSQAPRQVGGIQLTMTGGSDGAVKFPSAIDPALPSVDRMSRAVYATLGDTATAQLDLCITPSGKVTKLALARGTSMPELDAALLADAKTWRFEAMPGPDSVQICDRAEVSYHPY